MRHKDLSSRNGSSRLFPRMSRHIVFGEIADLKCVLSLPVAREVWLMISLYSPIENREFVRELAGDGFRTISVVENAGHLVSLWHLNLLPY